jgi:hypothetical protein
MMSVFSSRGNSSSSSRSVSSEALSQFSAKGKDVLLGGREHSVAPKVDVQPHRDHRSACSAPDVPGALLSETVFPDLQRRVPVPPLAIPGISINVLESRKARTARTARASGKKTTRELKTVSRTARAASMRPPFWQSSTTETTDEVDRHHDLSVEELEAKINMMLGGEHLDGDTVVAPSSSQSSRSGVKPSEEASTRNSIKHAQMEETKRILDKGLLEAAASEGFRVMNMYRASKGDGTAWAPLTHFRFVVDAEQQMLTRIEQDVDYIPGTRRPFSTRELQLGSRAVLQSGEMVTATWSVKDLYKVEPIHGPLVHPHLVGTAFTVWVKVGDMTRPMHLWAPGPEGFSLMQAFSRALEIASSRLMYLGIKVGGGSKGLESGASPPLRVLRLGIDAKQAIIDAAQQPRQLRSMVTTGALTLRGPDASSVWTDGYRLCADDLRVVIARAWHTADQRRKVAEKLRLAGILTCSDLLQVSPVCVCVCVCVRLCVCV